MSELASADEALLAAALERWLLTPAEVEKCRRVCRERRLSAVEALRECRLLEPADLAALLEWVPVPAHPTVAGPSGTLNRRYEIRGLLAEGGMGRVWLVHDPVRGEELALKTLRKERAIRHSADRFAEEFKILAGLRHPNVQAVYDYGVVEEGPAGEVGSLFFTCERIDGRDLMRATEGTGWRAALPLLAQLCRGLQFLHARALMHLDVKPDNVLACAGGAEPLVKLVDFGLAQAVDAGEGLEIMGTLAYVSPEMIRGEGVDARADLYGLGVTMFQVLSRHLPFSGASPRALLQAHVEAPVPSLRERVPGLPPALDELVRDLLAKHPGQRVAGADEALRRLSLAAGVSYDTETKGTLKGYVSSGTLIGRGEERLWLLTGWSRVERAEPGTRLLLVTGESGIGKSRLVREFRIWAQTNGVTVVEGSAEEGSRRPFGLFQEPLEQLVRQVEVWERLGQVPAGTVDAYAPFLRDLLPGLDVGHAGTDAEPLDPEAAWLRLLDKVSEFLLRAIAGTGLLLVLEDLHLADAASLALLEFLARRAATWGGKAKLLVVATLRDGEVPPEAARAVDRLVHAGLAQERRLRALARSEQAALVRAMFGAGSEGLLERVLSAEASGNPQFLEEVLKDWVDEEVLVRRPWGWEVNGERAAALAVPRGVREVIAQRLARLGAPERRWLGRLAVWGAEAREEDFWVLGLLGSAALADLVRRGLLREERTPHGSGWRFAHGHAAAAVAAAMEPGERKVVSGEFLRSLESAVQTGRRSAPDEVDRLARLSWEAGDGEAFRRWGAAAAERAEGRHAVAAARDLWMRLLLVEGEAVRRTALRERIGDLHEALGDLGASEACYREAIAEVAHRGLVATEAPPDAVVQTALTRLLRKLAHVAEQSGRVAEAGAWYEQALREMRAGGERTPERRREEARVLAARARFEGEMRRDLEAGERLAREALALALGCGEEGAEEVSRARLALGILLRLRGDAEGAREQLAAAEAYWRRRGNRMEAEIAGAHAGLVDLECGAPDAALTAFERVLAASEEAGDRRRAARAWGLISRAHLRRGDSDRALACLERMRALADEIGWGRGAAEAHLETGRLLTLAGSADGRAAPCEVGLRHLRLAAEGFTAIGMGAEAAEARRELERNPTRS